MKAVVVREWGDPQEFSIEDVPIDAPGPGEVLVEMHCVAISFGDTLIATGKYQVRPKLPFTPGFEGAGIVEAVGEGVTAFAPGDRVAPFGFNGGSRAGGRLLGTLREYLVAPTRNVVKLPDGVTLEQAALFRSNNETSYLGLQEARLKAGETLLVMGAGGGTGYAAVTLGKVMGARVIASARAKERRDIALAAGADHAIDSEAPDWREQVAAIVGPKGVDVVFDPVGGTQAERAFRTLGYGGRHIVIGFAAGEIPKIPLNLPLLKSSSLIGINLLLAWEAEPERIATNIHYLFNLLSEAKISVPPVAKRYPLSQTGEAIRAVSSGQVSGRVVVDIASAS